MEALTNMYIAGAQLKLHFRKDQNDTNPFDSPSQSQVRCLYTSSDLRGDLMVLQDPPQYFSHPFFTAIA